MAVAANWEQEIYIFLFNSKKHSKGRYTLGTKQEVLFYGNKTNYHFLHYRQIK